MKNHLRWKKKPLPTGLMRVNSGKVGSTLHDGKLRYATVDHIRGAGWYWVAGWESGIPHKNTCSSPVETQEKAKEAAKQYVLEQLEAARLRADSEVME